MLTAGKATVFNGIQQWIIVWYSGSPSSRPTLHAAPSAIIYLQTAIMYALFRSIRQQWLKPEWWC